MERKQHRFWNALALAACLLTATGAALADGPEPYSSQRPGGSASDPLAEPRDLSGRSVKTPRVRAIHDTRLPGSSGWLMVHDPWLAYQRGRDLCLREFSQAEGAFGEAGRLSGKTEDDEATMMGSRDVVSSCVACHNSPWRDMGAGITIQKNGGAGRNTPHLFGGGEVEMIGEEIRRQLLAQADTNHDGWISLAEAKAAGVARIESSPGVRLDFGRFDDADGCGRPDLNSMVYVWYVDAHGKRISWARNLRDAGVAGYNLEAHVFGFGQRDQIGHGALSSTLRAVASTAYDIHLGLQAHDPTANTEPNGDGLCKVSLAGAQQFYTGFTRDAGTCCQGSVSLDDPDRDGVVEEISEGDMDLVEWFLLNHPAPAEEGGARFERGRGLARTIGCMECHTSDWRLPEDRRFFKLAVTPEDGELVGHLEKVQPHQPFIVHGVYSDFRQHDLGPRFCETQYDGSQIHRFRTAPLWGVGSTAPYGHDGASLSLEAVIVRHGGEAEGCIRRYRALSEEDREALVAFLRGLVLYSTETLPCDLDGDGKVSQHFMVAGRDTGVERFNPEWLFRHPGCIEGMVTAPDGAHIRSMALTNVDEAYGCNLPGLLDRDGDGFPDILHFHPKRRISGG